jgi:hypothetical protein
VTYLRTLPKSWINLHLSSTRLRDLT